LDFEIFLKNMLIDLQIHSTYSDGYLTPTQLVAFLKKHGIKAAALTDHNTVSGIGEFRRACQNAGIKPVTGMELYAKYRHRHFNLLWYKFNHEEPALHDMLRDSQRRRRHQFRVILVKLAKMGFKFAPDEILDRYSHYVPLNHVIDDIMSSKENVKKMSRDLGIKNVREDDVIFAYFKNKTIGKLKNSHIDLSRILKMRKRIGGQIILCHPGRSGGTDRKFLLEMKRAGLDGLEKLSPHHAYGTIVYLQDMARQLNWIETGGSDFHREEGHGQPVQSAWQYFEIDSKNLRGVGEIIG
jgi:hypothetical protein